MNTKVDSKELFWKDNETGRLNKIKDFRLYGDLHVVWYEDVETLEEHCMDIDIFVSKHTAGGLFDDFE